MKKIMFVTGTRADYGKMKPLMKAVEAAAGFEAYIYISGMHLIDTLGNTYKEVLRDNYTHVHIAYGAYNTQSMSYNLGNTICNMTGYVEKLRPDLIVVHGDRVDALAGATTGALNNIRVAHVEGGEVSGTIDESIRHAISKFSHWHFVANMEAKQRLLQLGENEKYVFVIGSPDIDIMLSENLPSLSKVKERYDIPFEEYAILMYHPVTTELSQTGYKIKQVIEAVKASLQNYIIIYPNNDSGSEVIINEIEQLNTLDNIKIYPSLRFEYFLTLLKNAQFILGNSSAGVREAEVYGVPAVDIGTRQCGRYPECKQNIFHAGNDHIEISQAISQALQHKKNHSRVYEFGNGDSARRFIGVLQNDNLFEMELQKRFVDFTI